MKIVLWCVVTIASTVALSPAAHATPERGPHGIAPHVRHSTVTSVNWAGYAASGSAGSFSSVSASWTQPSVTCADGETSYSAFWVGLDGYMSSTVEQIGTSSDCQNGDPTYYAWYEAYPKPGRLCSTTIDAGDQVEASVVYASGAFTLTLTGGSGTCTTTAKATPHLQRASAEVIVEAPSSNHGPRGTLGLADFGTASFTDATVNSDPLSSVDPDKIVMRSDDSLKARPSDLDDGAFSVRWVSS